MTNAAGAGSPDGVGWIVRWCPVLKVWS